MKRKTTKTNTNKKTGKEKTRTCVDILKKIKRNMKIRAFLFNFSIVDAEGIHL